MACVDGVEWSVSGFPLPPPPPPPPPPPHKYLYTASIRLGHSGLAKVSVDNKSIEGMIKVRFKYIM